MVGEHEQAQGGGQVEPTAEAAALAEPSEPSEPVEAPVPKSCLGSAVALAGVLFGSLYVINPGFGVIELIPDNIPLFGNLDEAGATALLVLGLQYLFGRRR